MPDETESSRDAEPADLLFHETGRPRAALTETDREVLLDLKEYDSDQALRNAKHRIREHIRHSLLDMYLVTRLIDKSELKKIVRRQRQLDIEEERIQVGLSSGLFELATRVEYAQSSESALGLEGFFEQTEQLVESAVTKTVRKDSDDGFLVDIDVDISFSIEKDPDDVMQELISGNPPMDTIHQYLRQNNPEPLREALRERNEVINSEGGPIGPDHDLFKLYTGEKGFDEVI